MFNLASWGNFKAMVVSFLGLLLTDSLMTCPIDGNMAVLVECHNNHLSLVEQKLDCGEMF